MLTLTHTHTPYRLSLAGELWNAVWSVAESALWLRLSSPSPLLLSVTRPLPLLRSREGLVLPPLVAPWLSALLDFTGADAGADFDAEDFDAYAEADALLLAFLDFTGVIRGLVTAQLVLATVTTSSAGLFDVCPAVTVVLVDPLLDPLLVLAMKAAILAAPMLAEGFLDFIGPPQEVDLEVGASLSLVATELGFVVPTLGRVVADTVILVALAFLGPEVAAEAW